MPSCTNFFLLLGEHDGLRDRSFSASVSPCPLMDERKWSKKQKTLSHSSSAASFQTNASKPNQHQHAFNHLYHKQSDRVSACINYEYLLRDGAFHSLPVWFSGGAFFSTFVGLGSIPTLYFFPFYLNLLFMLNCDCRASCSYLPAEGRQAASYQ